MKQAADDIGMQLEQQTDELNGVFEEFGEYVEYIRQKMEELEKAACGEMQAEELEPVEAGEEGDISLTGSEPAAFPFHRFSMRWHTAASGT